jgi:hypothetical protein
VVSVVLSIACGHDASYPFKTTGAAESPVINRQREMGYYLSVVEKGGEPAGTRRFGFEWAYRSASRGRVIAGLPRKAVAQFSSRRAQITKTTLALAEQYEKDRRRALDQRALAGWGRFANAMTRRAKGRGALDSTALLRCWERALPVAELQTLRDFARTVWRSAPRQRHGQGRAEMHASNSRACLRGSRRAANSRTRKNVWSWPRVSRERKSHEQAAALLGTGLWQVQAQLHACAAGG